jgi:hypothetical protein
LPHKFTVEERMTSVKNAQQKVGKIIDKDVPMITATKSTDRHNI